MSATDWQKSSLSGGNGNDCPEVRRTETGMIELRESEDPNIVVTMTVHRFALFVAGIKGCEFDHLLP
jgi:hypothetical protein